MIRHAGTARAFVFAPSRLPPPAKRLVSSRIPAASSAAVRDLLFASRKKFSRTQLLRFRVARHSNAISLDSGLHSRF